MATKKLGGAVEESLTAIKLIASFANEEREEEKFNKLAESCKDISKRAGRWMAIVLGFYKFFIYGFYVYAVAISW